MRQYLTLVRLFWQQLVRRKSLWIVVAVVGVVLLVSLTVQSQMKGMLEEGIRYDIATRQAAAALDSYVDQVRQFGAVFVLLVAALVAPPSRKDGTTQFVLTLSVSRRRLAAAQFGALAVFIFLGTLVVHVGYVVTAFRLGILRPLEAVFSWPLLLLPLLLLAAASFSLSLTRPALLVYAILLGVPALLLPLLGTFVGSWKVTVPEVFRLLSGRVIDNLGLLFPSPAPLIIWPRLALPMPERPPVPAWGLEIFHALAAAAFWVVAGLWSYRRFDFGSRIPTK
jgi:ABC-type transport system involved in multi-copper enzyme maturation permease subunit